MALLFILLVIAGGMGLSVEAGLLGPLASQVGDLWATMSIFGIGAVLTFFRHCCKVSDEAAFCLIQRPYISKTLLTRRISPRGSP